MPPILLSFTHHSALRTGRSPPLPSAGKGSNDMLLCLRHVRCTTHTSLHFLQLATKCAHSCRLQPCFVLWTKLYVVATVTQGTRPGSNECKLAHAQPYCVPLQSGTEKSAAIADAQTTRARTPVLSCAASVDTVVYVTARFLVTLKFRIFDGGQKRKMKMRIGT